MNLSEIWNSEFEKEEDFHYRSNAATLIKYKCIRRIVCEQIKPEFKKPFPLESKQRMRMGSELEELVKLNFMKKGFKFTNTQTAFGLNHMRTTPELNRLRISGKIEGLMIRPGSDEEELFEIKMVSEYAYKSLYSIDDFYDGKWKAGWLQQVTPYMVAFNKLSVTFIIISSEKWDIKEFKFDFHVPTWNHIKAKCRTVNPYVRKKEIPSDEHCDFSECNFCPFIDYCQPSMESINVGYEQVIEDELHEKIARYIHIRSLLKEKDDIGDYLKARFNKDGVGVNAYISCKDSKDEDPIYELRWSERNNKSGKSYVLNIGELGE
jgi:hypothetical protein